MPEPSEPRSSSPLRAIVDFRGHEWPLAERG